jgi:hypothetical protein
VQKGRGEVGHDSRGKSRFSVRDEVRCGVGDRHATSAARRNRRRALHATKAFAESRRVEPMRAGHGLGAEQRHEGDRVSFLATSSHPGSENCCDRIADERDILVAIHGDEQTALAIPVRQQRCLTMIGLEASENGVLIVIRTSLHIHTTT